MTIRISTDASTFVICLLIFLLFLGLQLTGHISWSWWWVTAPLWLPFTVVLGVLVVAGVTFALFS